MANFLIHLQPHIYESTYLYVNFIAVLISLCCSLLILLILIFGLPLLILHSTVISFPMTSEVHAQIFSTVLSQSLVFLSENFFKHTEQNFGGIELDYS